MFAGGWAEGVVSIEELNASDALTKEYVYGSVFVDEVMLQRTGGTDYYFTHDYRFSVTSLTNPSGNIVESYDYKVYGDRAASGSGFTDVGYTGQRHDTETGLMYFKNRYYSVLMGCFVTRDTKQYIDGMSMYLGYFGGQGNDPEGNAWINKGGDIWEADSYNSSLEELAALFGAKKENWSCIWPAGNSKNSSGDWKDKSTYTKKFANKCDLVDVSNLTLKTGPELDIVMYLETAEAYIKARPNAKFVWDHQGVLNQIKSVSGQGKTPIQSFEIYGHGGSTPAIMTSEELEKSIMAITGNTVWAFHPAYDMDALGHWKKGSPDSPSPSYTRAKLKQGPRRAWFSRNAKVIGLGCQGTLFAKNMAEEFLREGAVCRGSSKYLYDFGTKDPITKTILEDFTSLNELIFQSAFWIRFGGTL